MNHKFFAPAMLIMVATLMIFPSATSAVSENIKLPYEAGQSFVVVQGYDSPPTHINKDRYALDLSQDGCDAYGKLALAASPGQVMLAQESGYNGGYGTQVLVKNNSNVVTRYAHLIPGTIPVAIGDAIVQGEPLGEIGNTGLVAGAACPTHPGTHLHFAMYGESADGSFSPFLPEPISNYVGIKAGKWYLSDNALAFATIPGATAIIDRAAQIVLGGGNENKNSADSTGTVIENENKIGESSSTTASRTNSGISTVMGSITTQVVAAAPVSSGGSVSASPPPPAPSLSPSPSSPPQNILSTTTPTTPLVSGSFDTSTLAIDLTWQPVQSASSSLSGTMYQILKVDPANASNMVQVGETTSTTFSYPLSSVDFGTDPQFTIEAVDDLANISTIQTIPVSLPDWFATTMIQPIDDMNSNSSWYSDNWYDLGSGFYGTIRSLTLEGFIDNSAYFASHLWLDEYLDPNYSQLNQSWTISDNAPFTAGMQKITIGGLNIPLQPNKYYRLRTLQDYQNRSVVLAGTSATGTAMWDEYVYGTGIVRHQYSFYPYLSALMIPNYPPLAPLNAPASMATSFDPLNSIVSFSWPAATDPDTTSSLLTYQWNIATSTADDSMPGPVAFDPTAWQSTGKNLQASAPVIFGNSYTIGVRTMDDLGNIGAPLIEPWNFPDGYAPVPQQLDHSVGLGGGGAQKMTLITTTTMSGIALWTAPNFGDFSCCAQSFISLRADNNGSPGEEITSSTITIGRYAQPGEQMYSFPTPIVLSAGLYWFTFQGGPATFTNGTTFFGSAGGDAYFRIDQ